MIQDKKGFTLIELLVVISIIAVLSSIALVVYTTTIKNGRDAKRQSDLRQIQSALEQYRADQLYYPMSATTCTSANNGKLIFTASNCTLKNPAGTKTYMNAVPVEPDTTRSQYSYVPTTTSGAICDNDTANKCGSYCLYADMENTSNTAPTGCSFSGTYDFGVTVP
jgi:prepilin-type N-terminal cleavage/methylation domain-containing protein